MLTQPVGGKYTVLYESMASADNPSFDWLRRECASIKSRRFHIFDPLPVDDLCYDNQPACFDEAAIVRGEQSRVYSPSQKATELYPGFVEWLSAAYPWGKSRYPSKQWKRIVDGPRPFSDEEMQIAEARRPFKWKLLGFADHGDALFEIENDLIPPDQLEPFDRPDPIPEKKEAYWEFGQPA